MEFLEHFLELGKLYLALCVSALLVIGCYQWLRAILFNDGSQLKHKFKEDFICILWSANILLTLGVL